MYFHLIKLLEKVIYSWIKNIEHPLEKSCFYSLFFMLGIEVLDGFSTEWDFPIMI